MERRQQIWIFWKLKFISCFWCFQDQDHHYILVVGSWQSDYGANFGDLQLRRSAAKRHGTTTTVWAFQVRHQRSITLLAGTLLCSLDPRVEIVLCYLHHYYIQTLVQICLKNDEQFKNQSIFWHHMILQHKWFPEICFCMSLLV